MTDEALVARKLATLTDHLARLRARRPVDVERLRSDLLLQDALALSVLVIVQEAVDIALHIASDEGWGVGSSYRESFEILARRAVISEELAAALGRAAALRNRIAHGYATVDADRLWGETPADARSFETFATAIASYLRGSG